MGHWSPDTASSPLRSFSLTLEIGEYLQIALTGGLTRYQTNPSQRGIVTRQCARGEIRDRF